MELATRNGFTPMSISRVIAEGASLVCRRGEHQVTGERSLNRDVRDFTVSNLTDQDHVGGLTQHRPQDRAEAQTDRLPNLDLIDACRSRIPPGLRR